MPESVAHSKARVLLRPEIPIHAHIARYGYTVAALDLVTMAISTISSAKVAGFFLIQYWYLSCIFR